MKTKQRTTLLRLPLLRLPLLRAADCGSALLITLFFLVIISIVAVGFMSTVRVERSVAHAHFERMRAMNFAGRGIEQSIATLRRETAYRYKATGTDGVDRYYYRHYITQPGALIVPDFPAGTATGAVSQTRLRTHIPLSSGKPQIISHSDPALDPPNLNIQTFFDSTAPTHLLTDQLDPLTERPSEMRVKWVYIRQNRSDSPDDPSAWTEELDLSEEPILTNPSKPLIGRYAYWVDDESSKLNYNIAWKRDPGPAPSVHSNPSRAAHPSRVNLMALTFASGEPATEKVIDALFQWRDRSPNRPFNSFADARQANAELSKVLDFNKFELTHYNHDPDTTFFGENRIILTTRRDLIPKVDGKYTRKFLDILRDDIDITRLDPGVIDDIAGGQQDWRADRTGRVLLPNKLDGVVRDLVRYISEKNWPVAVGSSFKDKYYPGSAESDSRIAQIALNIIDYVRAKESRQVVIAPLNVGMDEAGRYTLHSNEARGSRNAYQGVCRTPYITEMGFSVDPNPVTMPLGATTTPADWPHSGTPAKPKPLYPCYLKVELFLPQNYNVTDRGGMTGIDLVPVKTKPFPAGAARCWFISFSETHGTDRFYYAQSPTTQAMIPVKSHSTHALPIVPGDVTGNNGTLLLPGKYVTITKLFYREEPYSAASTAAMRVELYQGNSGLDGLLEMPSERWPRINAAPLLDAVEYAIGNPTTTPVSSPPSIETDDPRCNVSKYDWQTHKEGKNTFGAVNSVSTLGKTPGTSFTGKPQQDTDENGRISDFSLYLPPPRSVGSNSDSGDGGLLTSIGEIGFVNTGMDAVGGSTPWRSIRLQPNNSPSTNVPPDWALMDLFGVIHTSTTKVKEFKGLYSPHGTSIGGRVNVNSHVEPFDTMERSSAVRAVFTGAKGLRQKSDAATIARNIYHRRLATGENGGKVYGYPWKANPEAGESDGFDLPGEICEIKGVADWGEKSEDLVREVASLLTVRTGVFGIYTVGQSLTQTPTGKLVVTGEQRQHSIIERYTDDRGTLETQDDEIRFRTIYSRILSP